jgi:hypothetical protein
MQRDTATACLRSKQLKGNRRPADARPPTTKDRLATRAPLPPRASNRDTMVHRLDAHRGLPAKVPFGAHREGAECVDRF